MQESAQQKKGISPIKRLLFSATLAEKNASHKIAYISVMTAIVVVANMFFEFKFADTQFSLTIVVSALCGLIIGPLFGFAACFLGDLVGYLYHSAGFAYMPWIGIAMGMVALVTGFVVNGIKIKYKWGIYVKIGSSSTIKTLYINQLSFFSFEKYTKKDVPTFSCESTVISPPKFSTIVFTW
jgi:uncharacterized membrane protein